MHSTSDLHAETNDAWAAPGAHDPYSSPQPQWGTHETQNSLHCRSRGGNHPHPTAARTAEPTNELTAEQTTPTLVKARMIAQCGCSARLAQPSERNVTVAH